MRKLYFSLLFILGCPTLHSQSWVPVPVQLNSYAHCLYTDSVDNLLYLGGLFGLNGTDSVRGVAIWDNNTISGCGEGINSFYQSFHCGVPLSEIVRFQNKIYVGGGATQFTVGDSIWTKGVGIWDGMEWDSINVALLSDLGNPTGVLEMKAIGNTLYVGGGFTNINGTTEANGLAKFDGTNWSAVHDFPNWGGTNVNVVRHIAEYNGEIYVAGQLADTYPYDTMFNICRFNGTKWEQLGDGIGGGFSTVYDMEVYNGKLYVCGSFSKQDRPLNPGNRIAVWNGAYWEQVVDIQGSSPGSYAYVKDMAVLNGELYIVGSFEKVNGYPASNFAKYNGSEWCTYPDVFDAFIDQVEVYEDEVYITGYFSDISGAPISLYAKFDSNATPTNCVSVVGVEVYSDKDFAIYPNPSTGDISISVSYGVHATTVELLDLDGRVLSTVPFSEQISFKQAPGMYLIRLSDERGTLSVRKIILN